MEFSELLISEDLDLDLIVEEWHSVLKKQPSSLFHYPSCLDQILSYYSIVSLEGVGAFSEGEIKAAALISPSLKAPTPSNETME